MDKFIVLEIKKSVFEKRKDISAQSHVLTRFRKNNDFKSNDRCS